MLSRAFFRARSGDAQSEGEADALERSTEDGSRPLRPIALGAVRGERLWRRSSPTRALTPRAAVKPPRLLAAEAARGRAAPAWAAAAGPAQQTSRRIPTTAAHAVTDVSAEPALRASASRSRSRRPAVAESTGCSSTATSCTSRRPPRSTASTSTARTRRPCSIPSSGSSRATSPWTRRMSTTSSRRPPAKESCAASRRTAAPRSSSCRSYRLPMRSSWTPTASTSPSKPTPSHRYSRMGPATRSFSKTQGWRGSPPSCATARLCSPPPPMAFRGRTATWSALQPTGPARARS